MVPSAPVRWTNDCLGQGGEAGHSSEPTDSLGCRMHLFHDAILNQCENIFRVSETGGPDSMTVGGQQSWKPTAITPTQPQEARAKPEQATRNTMTGSKTHRGIFVIRLLRPP